MSSAPKKASGGSPERKKNPAASPERKKTTAASPGRKNPAAASSGRKNPAVASSGRNNRKKNLYRKSRYYRRRQRRIKLACIALFVVVLLILCIALYSCLSKKQATDVGSSSVQDDIAFSENSLNAEDSGNTIGEDNTSDPDETLPREPVSITVSVVGDCTLGTDEYFDYSTSLNAYYDNYGPEYFMQNVKEIFSQDDLTIANFEGVLTDRDTREDKQFAFKAPASFAKILSSSSVETVNTANNHSHDYGQESFQDTMAALDAEGIIHFGYDETAVVDVKGIKVGLVGIYELNDHLERTQQLKDNIAKVKGEGAELVIVIFHWGNEKEDVPDSNQMTLGRMAIDEGADLVCGHHPHVLQGIETYKGKKIVYSLGNFCFGGNSYPSDMDTMIFQQTFTITEEGVQADDNTKIIPCLISSDYGYNNYQPTPAQGDEAQRILNKIQERSSWIDTSGVSE